MPITTTPSERIGLCTRMRRFLVRFIRPESFVHTRSSAGFTITTSEFKFSVHTGETIPVELDNCLDSRQFGTPQAAADMTGTVLTWSPVRRALGLVLTGGEREYNRRP